MANHAHKPSDHTRWVVECLAGYGIKHEDIGHHPDLQIGETALVKYYREELDTGNTLALAMLGRAAFARALAGSDALLIFLMKTRVGLREVLRVESTGIDGGPILVEETASEIIAGRLARLRLVGESELVPRKSNGSTK